MAYKGQLFSARMDWRSIVEQIQAYDSFADPLEKWEMLEGKLRELKQQELLIALPVAGAVLAQRVRVVIAAGLVDLNRLLEQATIRRKLSVSILVQ